MCDYSLPFPGAQHPKCKPTLTPDGDPRVIDDLPPGTYWLGGYDPRDRVPFLRPLKLGTKNKIVHVLYPGYLFGRATLFKSSLALKSSPSAATVQLDGAIIGKAPLELKTVNPGTHIIRVSHSGYVAIEREVHFVAGVPEDLHVSLEPNK